MVGRSLTDGAPPPPQKSYAQVAGGWEEIGLEKGWKRGREVLLLLLLLLLLVQLVLLVLLVLPVLLLLLLRLLTPPPLLLPLPRHLLGRTGHPLGLLLAHNSHTVHL